MKNWFKVARERVMNSKIYSSVKGFIGKVFNSNAVKTATGAAKAAATETKDFMSKHNGYADSAAGNVMHRFQDKIKKKFRSFSKFMEKDSKASKIKKLGRIVVKIMCVVATVGFISLVAYLIKDVFSYCLMLVATCAAVILCIEFILLVLSTAFGCKI